MPARFHLPLLVLVCAAAGNCKEITYEAASYDDLRPDDGQDVSKLPEPCAGDVLGDCDPLSAGACADSDSDSENDAACQWGYFDGASGFFCFTNATESMGAACDRLNGPWCAAGLACADGVCRAQCCSDDDCAGGFCSPAPFMKNAIGGTFGYCRPPDPCAGEMPQACDPLTNAGCGDDTDSNADTDSGVTEPKVCDFRPAVQEDGFHCYPESESTGAEFGRCHPELGPFCARAMTCLDGICTRYCCADADCPSLRCESDLLLSRITGGNFGVCAL